MPEQNNDFQGSDIQPDKAPPVSSQHTLYDLSSMEALSNGDSNFIQSLLQVLIDNLPATAEEMLFFYSQKNFIEMGNVAHKLKPSIDTLGIASLKGPIRQIQNYGKINLDNPEIPVLLQEIKNTLNQVVDQIKEQSIK